MADKRITDLPELVELHDDSLLVAEQDKKAYKISGALLRRYVEEGVLDIEEDLNQIKALLAQKGDSLEFDDATSLLWLTANGERIGDGVKVATSGGGGGGSENNAVLSMANTTGWIYKTITYGSSCVLSFKATSLEGGLPTGPLVLKVTVNNATKSTAEISQGDNTVDVGPWLDVGACVVKLNVTDVYGNSRTINFNITTVSLVLTSSFDATVPYTGAFEYPYIPTGSSEKTVHFIMDGKEIGTASVLTSGRQQSFTVTAQSHGSHKYEVYFEATIDGETVKSNPLRYDIMCLEEGNTAPVISVPYWETTVEQFGLIALPFIVYDPGSLTADIVQKAGDKTVAELTVDRTPQTWSYRPEAAGALELSIVCGTTTKTINLTVTESSINVKPETEALALYLSTYGRSNNEADPSVWESGDIAATLTGFNWASDGWQTDADGVTALRVSGDARVEIPYQIFAQDFRTTGKTIEIEFATRNVLNYDAEVITCYSNGRGLKVTAQRADINSEQSAIGTQYKEEEHVRLAFVVEKRTNHRLLMVYINGILSGAVQYPADDDFSQANPVGISIGSNDCTTDIYCIRVYDNDLTRYQILDNWIADTQLITLKAERYQRNNVYDDYGQIVIAKLPGDLPYLVLNAAKLPEYKGNKITVGGSYTDPETPAKSFSITGAEADVQGTSSAGYARKNYKIKFKGGFTQDGKVNENYQLGNAVPTNVFTFKADVASSEGANNVELVKLYNEICPFRTPPQLEDPRVRQGIDGYPIVIFHNNGADTVFIGKYNFNHDKGTPEVFGLAAGDESWEIRNNTSDRVRWKSADFSGTDWLNDFEARYPEDNTAVANLQALAEWLVSTDTDQATGNALTPAVTYGDVRYTHDTAEYRLAKFDAELSEYLDEESTIFYYLFTELFLMVDSRAKNAFPTLYVDGKWCWLPYDMDTALGINNEGALTFGYELEDIDTVGTATVYNGQDSVIWHNIRATRFEQIKAMYQQLRSDDLLSYDDVNRRFEQHQAKWPEAIFNEDAFYKYLEPLFVDGTSAYLSMLQGSKAEQRKWWLYNRFRYIDSKYNAGDAQKDFITLRGYAKSDIVLTPYADVYATIKFGSYLVQKRALRGSSYVMECPLDTVNDTETYIYSASQIAAIGDLSGYKVGYAEFSKGTKLQIIKLGDASPDYSNPNLNELYLGNNVLLQTLDVRNCPNLGTGEQKTVDVSGCTNIEHIYFDGTAIAGVTLPNGGIVKTLHLPGTMTNLTIRNQTAITEFVMPSYGNITTLRLENVSNAVPMADILAAIPANSRVRLIGFDWSFDSVFDILALYDRLDTMRGLDEQGNNVDKAQMSGTIRVDSITGSELAEMQSRYPDIKVVYQTIVSNLYFYDEMGTTLLYTAECKNGADGAYGGSTPTKESTAQYHFTHAGWSLTPGGEVDSDALKAVTTDRNVYAAFTETLRTYTVYWKNGNTTLETDTNVPYGTVPTYNGSEPVYSGEDAADYKFIGWTPEIGAITGDTTHTAVFKYSGIVSRKLIDKSISGEYANDRVTCIGAYAFYYCGKLTSVSFPAATSIGAYAFQDCARLTTADFPAATSIDGNAFDNCSLSTVNFPAVTSIGSGVFFNCSLTTVDLPALTSLGSGVFTYNSSLTAVILRNTEKVCTMSGNAFSNTPIARGTGYIYVPKALVDTYKSATNWSTFAAQFRALEDYTVDGTTTGELDPNKI